MTVYMALDKKMKQLQSTVMGAETLHDVKMANGHF